jgi:hypothetical protein
MQALLRITRRHFPDKPLTGKVIGFPLWYTQLYELGSSGGMGHDRLCNFTQSGNH